MKKKKFNEEKCSSVGYVVVALLILVIAALIYLNV